MQATCCLPIQIFFMQVLQTIVTNGEGGTYSHLSFETKIYLTLFVLSTDYRLTVLFIFFIFYLFLSFFSFHFENFSFFSFFILKLFSFYSMIVAYNGITNEPIINDINTKLFNNSCVEWWDGVTSWYCEAWWGKERFFKCRGKSKEFWAGDKELT